METLTTPPIANIKYDNGIDWVVEQEKLIVREACNGLLKDKYLAHGLVDKYVTSLQHVPYKDVGLNCQLFLRKQNSREWMKNQFLKPGNWLSGDPQISSCLLRLEIAAEGALCLLAFQPGEAKLEGDTPEEIIIVDCNFHHAGPFKVEDIQKVLESWRAKQSYLLNTLNGLLLEDLT